MVRGVEQPTADPTLVENDRILLVERRVGHERNNHIPTVRTQQFPVEELLVGTDLERIQQPDTVRPRFDDRTLDPILEVTIPIADQTVLARYSQRRTLFRITVHQTLLLVRVRHRDVGDEHTQMVVRFDEHVGVLGVGFGYGAGGLIRNFVAGAGGLAGIDSASRFFQIGFFGGDGDPRLFAGSDDLQHSRVPDHELFHGCDSSTSDRIDHLRCEGVSRGRWIDDQQRTVQTPDRGHDRNLIVVRTQIESRGGANLGIQLCTTKASKQPTNIGRVPDQIAVHVDISDRRTGVSNSDQILVRHKRLVRHDVLANNRPRRIILGHTDRRTQSGLESNSSSFRGGVGVSEQDRIGRRNTHRRTGPVLQSRCVDLAESHDCLLDVSGDNQITHLSCIDRTAEGDLELGNQTAELRNHQHIGIVLVPNVVVQFGNQLRPQRTERLGDLVSGTIGALVLQRIDVVGTPSSQLGTDQLPTNPSEVPGVGRRIVDR